MCVYNFTLYIPMSDNLRCYIIWVIAINLVLYLVFRFFSGKNWQQSINTNITWTNISWTNISWIEASLDMNTQIDELLK